MDTIIECFGPPFGLVKFPDPILKQVSTNTEIPPVLIQKQMISIMLSHKGIGLAANQVGLDYRCFAIKTQRWKNIVICNPEIIDKSKDLIRSIEGCLSVPGKYEKIRHSWITIKGVVNNKEKELAFCGIESCCVQHEIDHLNGILLND